MNQKTDVAQEELAEKDEFSHGFLPSLVILTLVILFGIVLAEHQVEWFPIYGTNNISHKPSFITLVPSSLASYHTISNGLSAFSGQALLEPSLVQKIGMLASIIIVYVVIPTFFFFNWRNRRIQNTSVASHTQLNLSSISYTLSAVLTLSIAATVIYSSVGSYWIRQSLERSQTIQENKDALISDLYFLSLNANQYNILPKELGGGNGTYEGFRLSPEQVITRSGVFAITANEKQITVTAQSYMYPSDVIYAVINENGQLRNLRFEGNFK